MPQRDFTRKREPVWFTVEDDRYDCSPSLIVDDLRAFGEVIRGGVTQENAIEKIEKIFEIVMTQESFHLYNQRKNDRRTAFDHEQLRDIIEWLLEVYTKRPTRSPSDSTTGSPNGDAGSDSTAGASDAASIQQVSTPIGS